MPDQIPTPAASGAKALAETIEGLVNRRERGHVECGAIDEVVASNLPLILSSLRALADMRENQQTIRNALDFASKGAGVLAAMTKGAKLMLGHKAALDLSEQIELAKEALSRSPGL